MRNPWVHLALMTFRDRTEAGRLLARAVLVYRGGSSVVLALPRGGVPVAAEVAHALKAPLDLLIVRKIGVPSQPELAMGALVERTIPLTLKNDDVIAEFGISAAQFAAVRDRELTEARRRRACYLGNRLPIALEDKTVIMVDDGIATGASMRAAIAAVRQSKPRQIVVAVPVAPPGALAILRREADAVVCLEVDTGFRAIGDYYDDFAQVGDDEVIAILRRVGPAPRDSPPS